MWKIEANLQLTTNDQHQAKCPPQTNSTTTTVLSMQQICAKVGTKAPQCSIPLAKQPVTVIPKMACQS